MCGIVGFNGHQQAAPILLQGLTKLEYRGYDSAGLCVRDGSEPAVIIKAKGRLSVLKEKTNDGLSVHGDCGIGHTRWATHGEPSETNAHPHCSDDGNVIGVHNGIIENYQELKEKLLRNGYTFYSETDTEIAIKLIDYYYKKYLHTPVDAINHALVRIRGSYALELMFKDYPGEIYVARKDSPMILGIANGESYIASDVPAILKYTRTVYYIGNQQLARVGKGEITFYNLDGDEIEIEPKTVEWDAAAAEKGGYEHFMMKEIKEQPDALRKTLSPRITEDNKIKLDDIELTDEQIKGFDRIYIVGCGSAYHVGVVGKYVIEQLARIPVEVDIASEFRYRYPLVNEKTLTIIISQSGETADTLEALREAKRAGSRTLAIVNVVGSSIASEADDVLYTWAGPEISVATTKAYSTQLSLMYLLAIRFALAKGSITESYSQELLTELQTIPDKVEEIFKLEPQIERVAETYTYLHHAYFIGRNLDYAVALEASLKLKEISYIHSEAYAAGELKHGTISLIEPGTSVIALCCCERLVDKTVSNAKEVLARGAQVFAVANEGNESVGNICDHAIYLPKTNPLFQPSIEVVPLQLLGYYTAKARKCDIDKPRNLAKSVTVE